MAMMDDVGFLISHIRNSFITSDDTGMCEIIIETEENEKDRKHASRYESASVSDSGMESSDNDLSGSLDILPDMGYHGHRLRSNTAQRLERMKKEKRSQRKVKNIPWRSGSISYTEEEKGHLFDKKSLPELDDSPSSTPKTGMSKLALRLESCAGHPDNPFLEYAKFDGKASLGVPSKKIDIFLTMAPPHERGYPMPVVGILSARIQELIGLICWQYTNENREPKLHEKIDMYCLHIVEDDGEVDMDFPSLDNREPVSKFGFSKLALVEKNVPASSSPRSSLIVTVYVPLRGFNKFQVDSMNVTMKDILQRVLKRRKVKIRPGQSYNLERQSEPGIALDIDATLASMDTMEFCLVRENSTRGEQEIQGEIGDASDMDASLTSHQYKCYIVSLVHRLRANTDVQLGISGEKVEIDPVASKGTGRIFRQKPVTYDADCIASCEIIDEKPTTGKSAFRLIHFSNHDYKHHDFETDVDTANEIVSKMHNILELRLSPVRKEYVAARTRKLQKKRDSINFSVF